MIGEKGEREKAGGGAPCLLLSIQHARQPQGDLGEEK
jgi:hypothetical protein